MKRFAVLWLAVLLMPGTPRGAGAAEPQGKVRLSGAWALYPMAVRWVEEFQKAHGGVLFSVSAGGTGKGMGDVLAGTADIAMCSRGVTPLESAQGALAVAVCKDAVVPVINARNPVLKDLCRVGARKEALAAVWLRKDATTWGDVVGTGRKAGIRVYTRSDACGAAETWAKYLGVTQADLKGAGVHGDPGVRGAVRRDPLALSYNNVNYAYDPGTGKPAAGLAILPLDLNGNGVLDQEEDFYRTRDELLAAIRRGAFPSPPARDLYFVIRGKAPGEPVKAFLAWVLGDGQGLVAGSGYITLSPGQVDAGLRALGLLPEDKPAPPKKPRRR